MAEFPIHGNVAILAVLKAAKMASGHVFRVGSLP